VKIFKWINDFVESARTENGYGKFYRNINAIVLANSLSDMQIKKYKRYGIVPAAFFMWLRESGIVKSTMEIPYGGASKQEFLKIFKQNYIQTEQERSACEYREKIRIQKFCAPELNKAFANQDHIWSVAGCM